MDGELTTNEGCQFDADKLEEGDYLEIQREGSTKSIFCRIKNITHNRVDIIYGKMGNPCHVGVTIRTSERLFWAEAFSPDGEFTAKLINKPGVDFQKDCLLEAKPQFNVENFDLNKPISINEPNQEKLIGRIMKIKPRLLEIMYIGKAPNFERFYTNFTPEEFTQYDRQLTLLD